MPRGDGIEGRAGDRSTALSCGAAMPRRCVALLRAVNVGGTGTLAMIFSRKKQRPSKRGSSNVANRPCPL